MLHFIHISTQEIFTYWLIGSLWALTLPRLSLCMSVCFSQMAAPRKNIFIIPCDNLSSGRGDLQTANWPEGGWKLGLFKYLFFLKEWEFLNAPIVGPVSSPAAGRVWKGTILPDYGRWSGGLGPWVWLLGSFPPLSQPQIQLADGRWQYLRIEACQVVLMSWQ